MPIKSEIVHFRNPAHATIVELDGIRGIAVLLVLLVHCYYRGPGLGDTLNQSVLAQILVSGWTGVELFFVLSGFLITHIVLKALAERKGLTAFYIHRFGRIVPLCFLLIFAISIAGSFFADSKFATVSSATLNNLFWYVTFTSNIAGFFGIDLTDSNKALGPLWSVALEQQYYVLWPPLLYWLGARRGFYLALTWIGISFLLRLTLSTRLAGNIFYTFPLFHLDGLLIGSCAAIISAHFQIRRKWLSVFSMATLAGVLVLMRLAGGSSYQLDGIQVFGFTLVPLFYAGVLLKVCSSGVNAKLLRNEVLRKCGKYSYCIYLFHLPFLLVASQMHLPAGPFIFCGFYMCFVTLNLIFAKIVWEVFERPANDFFRRLAAKWASETLVFRGGLIQARQDVIMT